MTMLGDFLITYSFLYLFLGLFTLLQLKEQVFRDEMIAVVLFWPMIIAVYLFVTIALEVQDVEEED